MYPKGLYKREHNKGKALWGAWRTFWPRHDLRAGQKVLLLAKNAVRGQEVC